MLILSLALAGCAAPARRSSAVSAPTAPDFYARADLVFDAGVLYKPVPADPTDLSSRLAPLIIGQVPEPSVSNPKVQAATVRPHSLSWANGAMDVSVSEGVWDRNGRLHRQVTYFWMERARPQGVRITLDTADQPVIWESLGERQARVLYVARSLEADARAQYGVPHPGRRYSIETDPSNQPGAVVATLVDDGPIPMGPMVYVLTDGTISTIQCRCTPAQVRRVLSTREYRLLPASHLPSVLTNDTLDDYLRLPDAF